MPKGNPDGGQWTNDGRSIVTRPSREVVAFEDSTNPWTEPGDGKVTLASDTFEIPAEPPNANLDANILEALRHRNNMLYRRGERTDVWFYHKVKPGGEWDYKRQGFAWEDFGNFQYGATGAAAGFSEEVLLRMAGRYQNSRKREWGQPLSLLEALSGRGGKPPFGDDPRDQYWISKGVEYYQKRKLQFYRQLGAGT